MRNLGADRLCWEGAPVTQDQAKICSFRPMWRMLRISPVIAVVVGLSGPTLAQQNVHNNPALRAVFIAHAYVFVTSYCPTWRPNEPAIQSAIVATGYTFDQLSRPPLSENVRAMTEYLGGEEPQERAVHCQRLVDAFGPFGTVQRGLFLAR